MSPQLKCKGKFYGCQHYVCLISKDSNPRAAFVTCIYETKIAHNLHKNNSK